MTKKGGTSKEPRFLVLVRGSSDTKDVYIMANDDGSVRGFASEDDVNNFFLRSYGSAHARSYEGSMSACMHFIQYMPHFVEFKGLEDVKQRIAADPPVLVKLWGIAGGMKAVTCRPEAYDIWHKAKSVPLIK